MTQQPPQPPHTQQPKLPGSNAGLMIPALALIFCACPIAAIGEHPYIAFALLAVGLVMIAWGLLTGKVKFLG